MQLSKFSDFAFRALIYLASNSNSLFTIEFLSKELKISQNHLKKIIHKLSKGGFLETFKGNRGGIRLALDPKNINLAKVLVYTEANTSFINCLKVDHKETDCPYHPDCNLKIIINSARNSFIDEFSKFNLTDLLDEGLSKNPKLHNTQVEI